MYYGYNISEQTAALARQAEADCSEVFRKIEENALICSAKVNSVPRPDSGPQVRNPANQGWYPKDDSTKPDGLASQSPTYPVHDLPNLSIKLQ